MKLLLVLCAVALMLRCGSAQHDPCKCIHGHAGKDANGNWNHGAFDTDCCAPSSKNKGGAPPGTCSDGYTYVEGEPCAKGHEWCDANGCTSYQCIPPKENPKPKGCSNADVCSGFCPSTCARSADLKCNCDNFCINTNHDDSTCQQGTAITTAEQCAKAAKFWGLKTATISLDYAAKGCMKYDGESIKDHGVYFNNHASGGKMVDHNLVCKGEKWESSPDNSGKAVGTVAKACCDGGESQDATKKGVTQACFTAVSNSGLADDVAGCAVEGLTPPTVPPACKEGVLAKLSCPAAPKPKSDNTAAAVDNSETDAQSTAAALRVPSLLLAAAALAVNGMM